MVTNKLYLDDRNNLYIVMCKCGSHTISGCRVTGVGPPEPPPVLGSKKKPGLNRVKVLLRSNRGRRGGLMVSALDSGSDVPGSSPGRGTALCSWARHFTPIVPLSTQVYKWVPANLLLGVTLRWTSIPSRGE